jgi:hypothetical protein
MKRWYFDLKRVVQEDDHGCGIASVAIACGVTYERARAEFFPRKRVFVDDESLHVVSDQMINVVRRLGFSCSMRDTFRGIMRPVLVPFAWHPGSTYSQVHCVVWDPWAKKFIDPGYDHDYNHESKFYIDLWKRSQYRVLAITGRAYGRYA